MNGYVLAAVAVSGVLTLVVPRRWAALPLLMGCCYLPFGPKLDLGPFHFNAIRLLIAFSAVRATVRGEWWIGRMNSVDSCLLLWAGWLVTSSVFHKDPTETLVFRLGLAYDACGLYFLVRSFCRSVDDIVHLSRLTAIVLTPLALGMLYEKLTVHNLFSIFGGVGETPMIREGHVRANGPFGHPILAGTVGAVALPLVLGLRNISPKYARLGSLACLVIVFSCASSGPILSAAAGLFAMYVWRHRARVKTLQKLAILGYIALDIVMKDPAYFLVARIDLAGGSTSWYRARLIQSAFEHLSEWWLVGTDYTRHWMWVVVSWSPDHTDITSHYIQMGVYGGLPLMILFIFMMLKGFKAVTAALDAGNNAAIPYQKLLWAVGSSLFAQATTMFSVSYFDQSFVFLYLPLATVASAWATATIVVPARAMATAPTGIPSSPAPRGGFPEVPRLAGAHFRERLKSMPPPRRLANRGIHR